MKINYKKLLFFIIGTIFIGSFFSIFIRPEYNEIPKTILSPPAILFPIVWTILYTLMGVSLYLVSESRRNNKEKSYLLYILQLIVNSTWYLFFFGFRWYLFSFFWIILLIILVILMIREFYKYSEVASYLQIPYLLWLVFASILNLLISLA